MRWLCVRYGSSEPKGHPGAPAAQLEPAALRASTQEISEVTGCVQGAVAPLNLAPDVPVLFDEAIGVLTHVNIASGDPMAGLELAAGELIRLSGARIAAIAAEPAPP